MAKQFGDTNQGSSSTASGAAGSFATARFSDVIAHMREFGAWLASFDVSALTSTELNQLVTVLSGVESQTGLCRANVLAHIKQLGGDPIGTQKAQAKTSHAASKKNADTSAALIDMPNVKDKMADGAGMSPSKAALLAGAAKKTSADDVNNDPTLLDKVERQDEDKAKQTIDTWIRSKQSNHKRRSQRQKNIDERQFLMFLKDGKVHLHGNLPANVTNTARFRRWEAEKSRLWRLDGGREHAHKSIRSDEQRGADAYANIQDGIDGQVGGLRDHANWCTDVDNKPPPATPAPENSSTSPDNVEQTNRSNPSTPAESASPTTNRPTPSSTPPVPARSQIVIVARAETLDADDPDVLADIIGGGPLLKSELERHMCNSDLYGMLFDPTGKNPLWEGRKVRTCTAAQWRALLARDGGCVLTGVDPAHCEAHHAIPANAPSRGPTNIDNLVMVSVSIHHWLHDNKLTIYQEPDNTWNTRPATPEEIAPRGRRSRE